MESIKSYAQKTNNIHLNPYFSTLDRKELPLSLFLKSQEGFIEAVDHWTHIMCKLVLILPSDKERFPIIMNLYDEHGEGDLKNSHVQTFTRFLESLGYNEPVALDKSSPSHRICKTFNKSLDRSVQKSELNYKYMSALLGMIEYTYITVSRKIHNYATQFVDAENIEHYSLHEIVDCKHSDDMFRLCLDENGKLNDVDREIVFLGIRDGYDLFNTLYANLASFAFPTTT